MILLLIMEILNIPNLQPENGQSLNFVRQNVAEQILKWILLTTSGRRGEQGSEEKENQGERGEGEQKAIYE